MSDIRNRYNKAMAYWSKQSSMAIQVQGAAEICALRLELLEFERDQARRCAQRQRDDKILWRNTCAELEECTYDLKNEEDVLPWEEEK